VFLDIKGKKIKYEGCKNMGEIDEASDSKKKFSR